MSTNLKDFLKPTKGKIVVFVLIFFLAINFSLTIYIGTTVGKVERILCPHYWLSSYIAPADRLAFLLFITDLIYWYLLSCLIIFIYARVKEKLRIWNKK